MTAYPKPQMMNVSYEEAIRRQVQEKKQQRTKQLADVEARRKLIYRNMKRKYQLKAPNDIDTMG